MKGINLENGQKFGRWQVIDDTVIVKNGRRYVKCRCECGKEQLVASSDLVSGRTNSCKSCVAVNRRRIIPIGTKSKSWTIVSNPIIQNRQVVYEVQCDCGNTRLMNANEFYNPNKAHKCQKCAGIDRGIISKIKNGIVGELDTNKFGRMKRIAAKRNIKFDVSQKYLWDLYESQNRMCAITGDSIPDIKVASLDRIDSNLPYTEGNVQWVSKQANLSKHIMSMQELYEFCKKVLNHANQQPSQPLTKLEGSETN